MVLGDIFHASVFVSGYMIDDHTHVKYYHNGLAFNNLLSR